MSDVRQRCNLDRIPLVRSGEKIQNFPVLSLLDVHSLVLVNYHISVEVCMAILGWIPKVKVRVFLMKDDRVFQ